MPPRRRAQGPPSSPPPLPPPTRRGRQPSSSPPRLPPLQTRPPYAPSELLPEGTKRRKLLSARAKAAEDQELNKDMVPLAPAKIPGRATAKQQKEWSDYLQRQGDAANRAKARRQREEEEWEAEKVKYGEAEALRRRREEIEARRVADMASTSEIDELDHEDRIADPELDITATLRVNKKLEWSSSLGTQHLKTFTISSVEEALLKAIDQRDGFNKGWNLTKYTAIVRGPKPPRRIQSFDELSELEWDKVVAVILQERASSLGISIEISAEIDKSTPKPGPGSIDAPIAVDRLTRTDHLMNQAHSRADTLAAAGSFDQQLIDHWQCHDKRCTNENGWCFVDYTGKHYDVDHTQQRKWAIAIANNEPGVSIYRPPTQLYHLWVNQQGSVTSLSRKSLRKEERDRERKEEEEDRYKAKADRQESTDWMSQFMAFQQQTMNMRMQESMANAMERQQEREEQREQKRTEQQQRSYPPAPHPPASYPPSYPPPSYPPPSHPPPSHPPPSHPPPWYIESAYTRLPPQQQPQDQHGLIRLSPLRMSSPIDDPKEEDRVIEYFFEWKKSRVEKTAWKERITEAQRIADTNMWSIDDLKAMEDPSSMIYRIAIQQGIPDAMARGFKADLKAFKPEWRKARPLMDLARE